MITGCDCASFLASNSKNSTSPVLPAGTGWVVSRVTTIGPPSPARTVTGSPAGASSVPALRIRAAMKKVPISHLSSHTPMISACRS